MAHDQKSGAGRFGKLRSEAAAAAAAAEAATAAAARALWFQQHHHQPVSFSILNSLISFLFSSEMKLLLPDRPFHNYRATESVDQCFRATQSLSSVRFRDRNFERVGRVFRCGFDRRGRKKYIMETMQRCRENVLLLIVQKNMLAHWEGLKLFFIKSNALVSNEVEINAGGKKIMWRNLISQESRVQFWKCWDTNSLCLDFHVYKQLNSIAKWQK